MREKESLSIDALMRTSGVRFGTSGARGLAKDMTDRICYAYTKAFLAMLEEKGALGGKKCVAIGGDLRPSTPRILTAVASALIDAGFTIEHCGRLPTPALAAHAISQGMAGIMVTGSHIPEDRNGIKFYKPDGEILKEDEQCMREQSVGLDAELFDENGSLLEPRALPTPTDTAKEAYIRRYVELFPSQLLKGRRIGVYEHSTVARDMLCEILERLGAEVVPLGRSEVFIPVDTEAIRDEDERLARHWCSKHELDCLISADGDGDRPLVSDEHGRWMRGDVIGILCARMLGARCVVTPISSNTAVERCGWFERVIRTRIGSPYVIAGMQQAEHEGLSAIVGYEANGGFLQQSDLTINGHLLPALPTRDAIIVPLAILSLAEQMNCQVSGLNKLLPQRYTFSDRLKDFSAERARELLAPMLTDDDRANLAAARALLQDALGDIVAIDTTDGVRLVLASGDIVHIRPSGNAPELRCYTESDSEDTGIRLNRRCLALLSQWLEERNP